MLGLAQPANLDQTKRLLGPDGRPIESDGGFLLDHYKTFAAVWQSISQTYSYRYDEALKRGMADSLAMRRDVFIYGCLDERYRAVTQLPWHIEPEEKRDKTQVANALKLERIAQRTPRLAGMFRNLEDAVWYGRYGSQIAMGPQTIAGEQCWGVVDHRPVNGDKIQFGWDGTPRVFVQSSVMEKLKAEGGEIVLTDKAPALKLDKPKFRERFIIHKYECDDADYYEGEMAGGVHGVGIRSRIYWAWWMRDEMLSWAVNYMRKVGTLGLMIFPFPEGNDTAQSQAEQNARNVGNRAALTVPVPTNADPRTLSPFVISPGTAGIDALSTMISQYWERHIQRYIIGQTLSSQTEGSGLGGTGVAEMHKDTKYQIIRGDAQILGETLTADFIGPLQRRNLPGDNSYYRFVFDLADPQSKEKLEAGKTLVDMGLPVSKDDLYRYGGYSRPQDTDEVVGGLMPVDPLNPQAPAREPAGMGLAVPEPVQSQQENEDAEVNARAMAELSELRRDVAALLRSREPQTSESDAEALAEIRSLRSQLAQLQAQGVQAPAREPSQPVQVHTHLESVNLQLSDEAIEALKPKEQPPAQIIVNPTPVTIENIVQPADVKVAGATVNVSPTPVTIENTVQPADVVVQQAPAREPETTEIELKSNKAGDVIGAIVKKR